jgi:peroxiredoxin Q/BCP
MREGVLRSLGEGGHASAGDAEETKGTTAVKPWGSTREGEDTIMGSTLEVGDKAPDFSLPDQQGKAVSLKNFRGKQVVLYFYPKDDTPGCTKESCDFRDVESQIVRAGAVIVGVSMDGKDSHQKFIKKYGLPFPLLSDEDASISKSYGVYKEKNMYGRKYWGIERSTFVIDPAGTLKAVFRKVKVDGHADEVLTALKS